MSEKQTIESPVRAEIREEDGLIYAYVALAGERRRFAAIAKDFADAFPAVYSAWREWVKVAITQPFRDAGVEILRVEERPPLNRN